MPSRSAEEDRPSSDRDECKNPICTGTSRLEYLPKGPPGGPRSAISKVVSAAHHWFERCPAKPSPLGVDWTFEHPRTTIDRGRRALVASSRLLAYLVLDAGKHGGVGLRGNLPDRGLFSPSVAKSRGHGRTADAKADQRNQPRQEVEA